jgi:hypothetical protein
MEGQERLDLLKQLTDIINEEIENDRQLIELCEKDSRLGFHSEAEGYKYFPEKIRWRMDELNKVLNNDVPDVKKQILNGELLFPEYTGKKPKGEVANCISAQGLNLSGMEQEVPDNLQWQPLYNSGTKTKLQWASYYDYDAMYVLTTNKEKTGPGLIVPPVSRVQVDIEPRRLWPLRRFSFDLGIKAQDSDSKGVSLVEKNGMTYAILRIPFKDFLWETESIHPIRLNVVADGNTWCPRNPIVHRLMLGNDNPEDLRWLIFK